MRGLARISKPERQHADQALRVVDDEDVVDVGHVGGAAPDGVDGVVDGRVGGQRDELALHDAAGRLLVVAQQIADVGGEARRNRLQQALDLLARQLREEVGGVVGLERASRTRGGAPRAGCRAASRAPGRRAGSGPPPRAASRGARRGATRRSSSSIASSSSAASAGCRRPHRLLHLILAAHLREHDEVVGGLGGRHVGSVAARG